MHAPVSHLVVLHVDTIPAEFIADFTNTVRSDRLELLVQSRHSGMAFAAIEWLMPTAIVVYLAKPYFESFLKEMGKDHYVLVKDGLKKIYARVAGSKAPEVTLLASTAGKVNNEQPYSSLFSVVIEGPDKHRFKLLIPRPITESEYELTIGAFLEFAERIHSGNPDDRFAAALNAIPHVQSTVLVVYDVVDKRIRPIDPMAGHRR
jgi:hypothetical protein